MLREDQDNETLTAVIVQTLRRKQSLRKRERILKFKRTEKGTKDIDEVSVNRVEKRQKYGKNRLGGRRGMFWMLERNQDRHG